jgi:hypothetical protein
MFYLSRMTVTLSTTSPILLGEQFKNMGIEDGSDISF